MSLKFHGIPVNPHAHPGGALVNELAGRTIYRLDEVLNTPEELDKVQWVIKRCRISDLNFYWGDKLTTLDPNGTIAYSGMIIGGTPPLYLILHDDSLVPPGCTQVDKPVF